MHPFLLLFIGRGRKKVQPRTAERAKNGARVKREPVKRGKVRNGPPVNYEI